MTAAVVQELGAFRIATLVTGGSRRENCYLVTHLTSGEQALLDPGTPAIAEWLAEHPGNLRHILLTHAHFDHVGGVAAVCRATGLSCQLHRDDARLVRQAPMYAQLFANTEIEQPAPCDLFDDEPEFMLGEQTIRTVRVPGHTAGSVCYVFPGFAFTGDTLLRESVGRTDLPGSDALLRDQSITRLLAILRTDSILYSGHGPAWSVGEALAWWSGRTAAKAEFTWEGRGA